MKTKLQILLFLILCLGMTVIPVDQLRAESSKGSTAAKISSKAPSEEYINSAEGYIKTERSSLAVNDKLDIFNAPRGLFSVPDMWDDPTMSEEEWTNGANMGAPIASASLPIVFSIFVLYLIYRSTTTSRKRNNF